MITKIAVAIILVLVGAVSSWFVSAHVKTVEHLENTTNSALYDLKNDLDLLLALRSMTEDEDILRTSEHIVVKRLLLVTRLRRWLPRLEGTPKRALCQALELNSNRTLFEYADQELVSMATSTLDSIEEWAKEEIGPAMNAPDGEDCEF